MDLDSSGFGQQRVELGPNEKLVGFKFYSDHCTPMISFILADMGTYQGGPAGGPRPPVMNREGGGSVTSHDMKGCWLLCGAPLFWELACKGPVGDDPDRYSECGIAFLCMGIPLPVTESWTRNPGTNGFRKDKDHNAVVNFTSGCYGNESCFIHKCKLFPC